MRSICSRRSMLLLALCLMLACSQWRSGKEGEEEQRGDTGGEFDPFAYPGDAEIVTATVSNDTTAEVDSSLYYIQAEAAPIWPEKVYRVQLFASQYYHEALEEKGMAAEVFDEPVLISYSVPYYRVEIGNFPSEPEAERFLRLAKRRGYSQCWVTSEPADSMFWINLEADTLSVDSLSQVRDSL